MPKEKKRRFYAASFKEKKQLDAEEWIAAFLFDEYAYHYERYPETAPQRLTEQILLAIGPWFIRPSVPLRTPRMLVLRQRITTMIKTLEGKAIDHVPDEDDCNEVGKEILYLIIETMRPDLLEPRYPAWLVNGAALGAGMAIAAILIFVVTIWPGWPAIAQVFSWRF